LGPNDTGNEGVGTGSGLVVSDTGGVGSGGGVTAGGLTAGRVTAGGVGLGKIGGTVGTTDGTLGVGSTGTEGDGRVRDGMAATLAKPGSCL
jgi:hypothetical protein